MSLTLAILKPDCVERRLVGAAITHIESHGFQIRAIRQVHLTRQEAAAFYAVHQGKAFFEALLDFMTSGPCFPMVLEHPDAVNYFRKIIGATDPVKAAEGTLRRKYAENVQRNIVHGSDSEENAKKEIAFFFPTIEIIT